ncbi:MAG: hypothetical protein AB7E05_09685 [Sphingobium sp.]
MTDKCALVAAYNDYMLSPRAFELLFGDDPSALADSLTPYFHDDVVLNEPPSLPWGGLWHGREGFAGEGKAFVAAFRGDYEFKLVDETFLQAGDATVYHNFEFNIVRRDDPAIVYNWHGVERYAFTGDKVAYLDVLYKDTAGLMRFLGLIP